MGAGSVPGPPQQSGASAASGDQIRVDVAGRVEGSVAVGKDIFQQTVLGGLVVTVAPGQGPKVREREKPVYLEGPKPPRYFAGRDSDVAVAHDAILEEESIQFFGPRGVGKTTLLRYLSRNPPPDVDFDGIVYQDATGKGVGDVLQCLFEAFYEIDPPLVVGGGDATNDTRTIKYVPTETQLRHYFRRTSALLLIDEGTLDPAAVNSLRTVFPDACFVLSGEERLEVDGGTSLPLRGLPEEAALTLMERRLKRALEVGERNVGVTVCRRLKGNTSQLLQVCEFLRQGATLQEIDRRLDAGTPANALTEQLVESLDEGDLKIVRSMATIGAPLSAEHLEGVTGISDAAARVASLEERGMAQAHSPRYTLRLALPDEGGAPDGETLARTARYFADWCHRHRREPERIAEDGAAIVATMRRADAAGRRKEVVELGRCAEGGLMLGARWGLWGEALDVMLNSARALGDRRHEALALHQLGTRALGLEDHARARPLLEEALRLREELGDREGAAVTRHNLEHLSGPPGGGGGSEPPSPPPHPQSPRRRVAAGLLLLMVAIVVALWTVQELPPGRSNLVKPVPNPAGPTGAPGPATVTTTPEVSPIAPEATTTKPGRTTTVPEGTTTVPGPTTPVEVVPDEQGDSRGFGDPVRGNDPAADLAIALSDWGDIVAVTNNGPSDAAAVEFAVTGENAVVRVGPGDAFGCRNVGSHGIACSVDALAAGDAIEIGMVVTWRDEWEIRAEVRGRPDDPDESNNAAVVRARVPDIPIPYTDFVMPAPTGSMMMPQLDSPGPKAMREAVGGERCPDRSQETCETGLPFTGADLTALAAVAISAILLGAALVQTAKRARARRKAAA